MDVGITLGDVPTSVSPRDHFDILVRQVEAAQRNGVSVLCIGQHFCFEGARWLQPVPLLARLAAEVDPHVRLATFVLIGPLYHPVLLAEELATLDIVTEGRLVVGVGLGYLEAEYDIFGVGFAERAERLEESLEVMKALWTSDRVTHHGAHFTLDDVPTHIRPVQQPHPPVWVGAQTLAGVRRAARLGDGWPITSNIGMAEMRRRVGTYVAERQLLGLGPGTLPLRREVFVGTTRDEAVRRAVERTRTWFVAMSSLGNLEMDHEALVADMRPMVDEAFVCGTAQECAAAIRAIGDELPVGPLLVRANWPGMAPEDVCAFLDELGREFFPLVADYEATTELRPPVAG